MYSIKLDFFEGPLDLLLHLVEKNQMEITEISLAAISGEYEEHLQKIRNMNLEVESSFLVVFASLLEIKSKMLLPAPPHEDEDEEVPEHELVTRLREYRKFKKAAAEFNRLAEMEAASYPRPECDMPCDEEAILTTQVTAGDLMDMYVSVIRRLAVSVGEVTMEVPRDEVSLPLVFRLIFRKIRHKDATSLEDLFDSPPDRAQFIITFLALLEMARRRKVYLIQDSTDAMIKIINRKKAQKETELEKAS